MTDYDREAVARLEARLRGGEIRLVAGRTDDYEIAVNLGGITEVFDPLDLDDPGDLLKWVELVKLLLLPMLNGQYHAAWEPGGGKNSVQADSPAAAIRAAVIALAEQERE